MQIHSHSIHSIPLSIASQKFVEEQALDEFVRQYSSCYSFSNDARFEQLFRKLLLDRLSNRFGQHYPYICMNCIVLTRAVCIESFVY